MQSVPCTKKARSGAVQAKGAGAEVGSNRAGLGLAGNHNRFHVVAGLRRAIGCHPCFFGVTSAVGESSLTVFFLENPMPNTAESTYSSEIYYGKENHFYRCCHRYDYPL